MDTSSASVDAVRQSHVSAAASALSETFQTGVDFWVRDGDSWEFTEIAFDGTPISKTELMLVNADLLFRDLRDSPERFASAPSLSDDG